MMDDTAVLGRAELAAEESAWLSRARLGDVAAIDALVSKHRMRLIRVAANILRDRNEAEDVAQEAFLKAFRELGKLREDKAFSGFLYRICVRLCMDRLRSRKPEGEVQERGEGGTDIRVETKILVEKLLAELSPELRMTLVLREMEQFSYEEVADYMGVPVGTVRSRLHTARERFRAIWLAATEGAR